MTSLFAIFTVWITLCVGVLSAARVSGEVSSTVVLPCTLKVPSDSSYIRWSTDKDIFERSGKEWLVGEGYEGRVDVPEDQLLTGDCSLVLHNLTIADKGVYKSYQTVRRTKRSALVSEKWVQLSSVELDVTPMSPKERTDKRLRETSLSSGDVTMNWPHLQIMALCVLSSFLFQLPLKDHD